MTLYEFTIGDYAIGNEVNTVYIEHRLRNWRVEFPTLQDAVDSCLKLVISRIAIHMCNTLLQPDAVYATIVDRVIPQLNKPRKEQKETK